MLCSTVRFGDVSIEKFTCSTYKSLLMIKYDNEQLIVQSPWIRITHYGIPKNDKYNTTEESRRYMKVPLGTTHSASKHQASIDAISTHYDNEDFSLFIKKLDEFFGSDEFKTKYLDDKQQKFKYVKLFKESSNDKYPPSLKLKMDVKDNDIKTEIYTDERKTEVINVKNMDEVAKAIPYKSEVRFLFKVHRLWIQASLNSYGVILKLRKIQVIKNKSSGNNEEFIDSDDDCHRIETMSASTA